MGRKKHRKLLTTNQNPSAPVVPAKLPLTKMDVTMSNRKMKQVKEFNGMLTCILEHEITKTTAKYEWTGPKIAPEIWNQVLAFFRWTYDTTKSESQVRLFVNHQQRHWAAWAFPQRKDTGMTTKELTEGETGYNLTVEQRAQFPDSEGWFYYGTVHHHCSAGAFQSGTDQHNEFSQDGLHITVGHIGREQYELDYRLYQSGYKLGALDMLQFWDVGDPLEGVPIQVKKLLPADALLKFVALQMGTPPPVDQEFPAVWKTNLIVPPPVVHVHTGHIGNYSPGNFYGTGTYYRRSYTERSKGDLEWDTKRAVEELFKWMQTFLPDHRPTLADIIGMLDEIEKFDFEWMDLLDIITHNETTTATFKKAVIAKREWLIKEELKLEQLKLLPKRLGNGHVTMEEAMDEHKAYQEELKEAQQGLINDGHHFGWGDGMGLGG